MFEFYMENPCTLHEQEKFIVTKVATVWNIVIVQHHYRAVQESLRTTIASVAGVSKGRERES